MFLLIFGAAHGDGIGPQERGQNTRGNAQVDRSHGFGNAIDVIRAAVHAVIFAGYEDQMQPHGVVQVVEHLGRKFVIVVELQKKLIGQVLFGIFGQRAQDLLAFTGIQSSHGKSPR